ncbi:hypothetical protein [Desulfosarcina variabilis]|uniref:hypothetical protein n=1 Tax=Desulfosarcina variabilis TaxID=2300 RepID=UPI003AFA28BA
MLNYLEMPIEENRSIIEWLMNNGGPVIRYRTAIEFLDNYQLEKDFIKDIVNDEKIQYLLAKLDDFGPIKTNDKRTLNAIHKVDGLEGYISKLLEFGFTKNIKPFDKKMRIFRQYVNNNLVQQANASRSGQDVRNNWAIFIAVLMTCFLIRAGYRYKELLDFVEFRTEALYRNAKEMNYDVYYDQSVLSRMLKRPHHWLNTPVLRSEFDPGFNERPLPNIWDIYTLAYFPEDCKSNKLRMKIDRIIEYVLDDRFQVLREGYGLLFFNANKRYYTCGWSPTLPYFHNVENKRDKRVLVRYVDLMARFKNATNSDWMKKCINHLEEFKTATGTYTFPKNYLSEKYVRLGENRRKKNAIEIESTFRMLLLKKTLAGSPEY